MYADVVPDGDSTGRPSVDEAAALLAQLRGTSAVLQLPALRAALLAALPRAGTLPPRLVARLAEKLMQLADVNGDGEVSLDEMAALLERFPHLLALLAGRVDTSRLPPVPTYVVDVQIPVAENAVPVAPPAAPWSSRFFDNVFNSSRSFGSSSRSVDDDPNDGDACLAMAAQCSSSSIGCCCRARASPLSRSGPSAPSTSTPRSVPRIACVRTRLGLAWATLLLASAAAGIATAVVRYAPPAATLGAAVAHSGGALLYLCVVLLLLSMMRRSVTAAARFDAVARVIPLDWLRGVHVAAAAFALCVALPVHVGGHIADWMTRGLSPLDVLSHGNPEGLPPVYAAAGTGIALLLVFLVMVAGYLARVWRAKYLAFYVTHAVGVPVTVILFILHAPSGGYALAIPLALGAAELAARAMQMCAPPLAVLSFSLMTSSPAYELRIARPRGFNFSPGQFLWLCVPEVSPVYHPFCISSPPEASLVLTLHIRVTSSTKGWTSRLRTLLEGRLDDAAAAATATPAVAAAAAPPVSPTRDGSSARHLVKGRGQLTAESRHSASRRQLQLALWAGPATSAVTPAVPELQRSPPQPHQTHVYVDNPLQHAAVAPTHPAAAPRALPRQLFVRIDGPYAAPCQRVTTVRHAVLVAAGMGITPAASILSSILARARAASAAAAAIGEAPLEAAATTAAALWPLERLDLVWLCNEGASFSWFIPLLQRFEQEAAADAALARIVRVHIFLTSLPAAAGPVGALLHLALDALFDDEGVDVVVGLRGARTIPGKPAWSPFIAGLVADEGMPAGSCGGSATRSATEVFVCGPRRVAVSVAAACDELRLRCHAEMY